MNHAIAHPLTQESLTVSQWANRLGLQPRSFERRLQRLGVVPEAFSPTLGGYKNPATGESLSASGWGKRLNISADAFLNRVQNWGLENPKTFEVGRTRVAPLCKQYAHPQTGECLTAKEWAEKLNISQSRFQDRLTKWGSVDPRVYQPRMVRSSPTVRKSGEERMFEGHIRQVWKNPATGESLSAKEWAGKLGLSLYGFYHRIQRLGGDNPETYSPPREAFKYTDPASGLSLSIDGWAKRLDLDPAAFRHRIRRFGADNPETYSPTKKKRIKKIYTDPRTLSERTASEWARYLKIGVSQFRRRIRHWGLDDPRTFSPDPQRRCGTRRLRHPWTKEVLTIKEWSERLNLIPAAIYRRLLRYQGSDFRVFIPKDWRSALCPNPATKEVLEFRDWADRLGISVSDFRGRVIALGIDDPRTFEVQGYGCITDPSTGRSMGLEKWAEALGITERQFRRRTEDWGLDDPRTFKSKSCKESRTSSRNKDDWDIDPAKLAEIRAKRYWLV